MTSSEIRVIDSNRDLELYSYHHCTNETPQEIRQCRGHIYSKNKEQLIVSNFGYTQNYTYDETMDISSLLGSESEWSSQWMFYYSMEGTLLRLFYYQDHWHLTTNKKLDAYRSRWSSRLSFGELMEMAISKTLHIPFSSFVEKLDPEYLYLFLLRPNHDTRIVCHVNQKMDKVFFLGRSELGEFKFESSNELPQVLPDLARPMLLPIENQYDFQTFMNSLEVMEYQGILVTHRQKSDQIKFIHPKYAFLSEIRGNNSNLRYRYLELRQDSEKLKLLYYLYPRHTEIFDSLEETILHLSRILYQFYVSRYMKNQFITLPREEYRIIKQCHEYYLQNKQMNRIFSKKILEIMNKEPPLHLYKMIRRFLYSRRNHPHKYDQEMAFSRPHSSSSSYEARRVNSA